MSSEKTSIIKKVLAGKGIVAVDIGISSVKICEISKGVTGGYTLDSFSYEVLSEAAIIEDEVQKPDEIKSVIKELLKRSGTKSVNVCIGLAGQRTMTKFLEVPDGSKEEVEDNILWESEQYISFGVENTEISHQVLGKTESGNVEILMAAASIDVARGFMSLFDGIGLKVKIIDLDVLALGNLFEIVSKGKEKKPVMLIDLGAQSTKLVLMRDNIPVFTKEIPVGSVFATEEIQRVMEIPYFEAEDLKMGVESGGSIPEEIREIIWKHNERIIEEVKKTITFYNSTSSGEEVAKVYLTGGGSLVEGWEETLEEELGISVKIFDPFEKIKIGSNVDKADIDFISRVGCVAMGLALRGI